METQPTKLVMFATKPVRPPVDLETQIMTLEVFPENLGMQIKDLEMFLENPERCLS